MSDLTVPCHLPINVEQIQQLLPHRYPFLLVDRVIEIVPDDSVVAIKNVTINEPFFQGHFPGHPVMPGVLIVEAMAQTAGLLTQISPPPQGRQGQPAVLPGQGRQCALQRTGGAGRPAAPGGDAQASDARHGPVRGTHPRRRQGSGQLRTDVRREVGQMIHPTALIDPSAVIGDNVSIGAYSVIGAEVQIGDGTVIGPHVVIEGPTRIGRDNRIASSPRWAAHPQDKKFAGEHTELVIGDRNLIREFVTINRGTGDGGGATRIGNDNWVLAYVHIAHDCQIGNNAVFSNYSALAGHVEIGDWIVLAGYSRAHISSARSARMPSSAWAAWSAPTCRRS